VFTEVPESPSPRPVDEVIADIHRRADGIRARRSRRRMAVGSTAVVAALAVGGWLGLKSPSPSVAPGVTQSVESHKAQVAADQLAGVSVNVQPPYVPLTMNWTVKNPAVPSSLATQYPDWTALVTQSLRVLEHEASGGLPATLSALSVQPAQHLTFSQGQYAGQTATINALSGMVTDDQGRTWQMTADMTPPATGGDVIFRGACSAWTTTGTTLQGTSTITNQSATCQFLSVYFPTAPTSDSTASISYERSLTQNRSVMTIPGP
jgi:hypothetical protein